MFIISYIHEFFNEQKSQEYINKLRWKDRPFICPRCDSDNIGSWGIYLRRPGLKRYMCKACNRTFNDLTNTLLDGCKLPFQLILLAIFLMCIPCSCQRICRELGVHIKTADPSLRWDGAGGSEMLQYLMKSIGSLKALLKLTKSTRHQAIKVALKQEKKN